MIARFLREGNIQGQLVLIVRTISMSLIFKYWKLTHYPNYFDEPLEHYEF